MKGFGTDMLTQSFSVSVIPAKMAAFTSVSSVGRTYRGERERDRQSRLPGMLLPLWA